MANEATPSTFSDFLEKLTPETTLPSLAQRVAEFADRQAHQPLDGKDWAHVYVPEVKALITAEQQKAQAFFEQLAASIVTPHVGEQHRDTIKSVLHRATEAGLYTEPK